MRPLFLVIMAMAAVATTTRGGAPCLTALDCQLNGACNLGACVCGPGFTGADCGELFLLPAALSNGFGSIGSPVSSWGAGVVHDPISGQFMMQVDEMASNCGLGTWHTNSRCVLAWANDAAGPYSRNQTLMDAWCHGSTPARDPVSGRWLFQHMGNAGASVNCTVCANGTTPPGATQGPCPRDGVAPYTEGAFISVGSDPRGPYVAAPLVQSGANCENWFMPNGTLFVACPWGHAVSNLTNCGSPNQNAFLAISRAENLDAALAGQYTRLPLSFSLAGSNSTVDPLCVNWEDQTLWVDTNGYFHTLMHAFRGVNTSVPAPGCFLTANGSWEPDGCTALGGHAYSLDGAHWWISSIPAYTPLVQYADGSEVLFRARERPHVLLGETGNLLYFISAVGDPGQGGNTGVPGFDHSFTLVQQVGGN